MEQFIASLIRAIVDEPQAVSVLARTEPTEDTYEVRVSPDDLGKIIGRNGRVANGLRTVIGAAGRKRNRKVRLMIIQ